MDNKEAASFLESVKNILLNNNSWLPSTHDPIKETFDMAIKALEQEPCEDAISRQKVLEGLASIAKAKAKSDAQKSLMGRTMFFVEQLPSVSVAEKVEIGHWSRKTKVDAYDLLGVKTWGIKCQCDRCTFTTIVVEDFGYYKYCPNCGCRMIESQESEVSDADSN